MNQRIFGAFALIIGVMLMSAGAPKQTFGDVAQTIIGLLLFIGGGAALFGTDFPKNDGNQPSKKIDDDLV